MIKRIGIITICKVNNYGAELQTFALQRKLNMIGYEAEIIDYLFYKNSLHRKEEISKSFVRFPLKKRLKEFLLPIISNFNTWSYKKERKSRSKGFDLFHKRYTRFSKVCYQSYSQLYSQVPIYDIYCVGSDQVWNPNCYTSLLPYLLTFAPDDKRIISYASSFGVKSLPVESLKYYAEGLKRFNSISVREKTGLKLINELIGREATHVLDPTLLLNKKEWTEIASTKYVPQEKYLLLYVLSKSRYIPLLAKQIAKDLDLKIIQICKDAYIQDDDEILNILDAAPDDFVGLFCKSSFVLTNSFHGTIFSILNEKPFFTVLPLHKDNNSRQVDLLSLLGLADRIVYDKDAFPSKGDYKLNYTDVNKLIDSERNKSLMYLNHAING